METLCPVSYGVLLVKSLGSSLGFTTFWLLLLLFYVFIFLLFWGADFGDFFITYFYSFCRSGWANVFSQSWTNAEVCSFSLGSKGKVL